MPLLPDEDDALYLERINGCIRLEGDKVWLEDSATGENLLTNLQAQRALREEKDARQKRALRNSKPNYSYYSYNQKPN